MTDEKKKMTAHGSSVGADDVVSQSLQILSSLYQTQRKKAILPKEIWRNFTERCAA